MIRNCVIGIVLLCSPVFAADKYALLIGVSKYEHSEMNKPEPLKFPEEDAKALGELLKKGGYEVDTLLGKAATRDAIETKLAQLAKKGSADGVVLIGLFGHGVEIETRGADNKIVMEGCFCPFTTELRIVKDGKGNILRDGNGQPLTEPDPASLVKLSDLMVTLKVAKAGNRVVLADCCRTVPNQARGRSFGAGFRAQDLPDNTSVLFGCSPNEKAFEHSDWGHGAFTTCLLEAVAELSGKGSVDTASLAVLLKKRVPELVRTVSPRDHQTPKLFTTDLVDLQLLSLSISKPNLPSSTGKPSPPTKPQEATGRGFEGTKAGDKKELVSGVPFIWCPAGTFTMGTPGATDNESPMEVTLTSGFWLGETEFTQGQWKKLMGTSPWQEETNVKEGDDYAASYITHDDAVDLCEKLTKQELSSGRLPKGWKYTLPTEAQWEYACRAGTKTTYSFGDSESQLGEYGWFDKNALDIGESYVHQVGKKKPNAWGLLDMHGNVWEWCSDWFGSKLSGGRDPTGPASGSSRVFRGGSWCFDAVLCRSADRNFYSPGFRNGDLGFRLAAVASE